MSRPKPRVLIWDLETGGVNAFYADLGFIFNFGYKWLGEKETHVLLVSDYPGWFDKRRDCPVDDTKLIKDALKIMEQADMMVAHYGDKFDRRFFQGRCAIHNFVPPHPTKQIDTWDVARKAFKFRSNRLGDLATNLGLTQHKHQKTRSEWPGWWLKGMAGNATAIQQMGEYCKQDVRTLEQVYLRERAYCPTHIRLYPKLLCRFCGGLTERNGIRSTKERRYYRLRCQNCGASDTETIAIKE